MLRTIILFITLLTLGVQTNAMEMPKIMGINIFCFNHEYNTSQCQRMGCRDYLTYSVYFLEDNKLCGPLSKLINNDQSARSWLYKQTFPVVGDIYLSQKQWDEITATWGDKKRLLYDKMAYKSKL